VSAQQLLLKAGVEEVVGNPTPPRSSSFEVTLDNGEVLWSKLDTGKFPTAGELQQAVQKALSSK